MNPESITPNQSPKTNPYLTPAYLLSLSSHIETLSSFYQQENLPSLSHQFKSFLQSTFKNLSNSLNLFSQDQSMMVSSLISTKVQLQTFLGQKLHNLLQRQTLPLAQILKFIVQGYRQNFQQFDEMLIREKKRKVQIEQQENEKVVNNLKKQVLLKRDYVKQLEERVKDLEEQNSKIYQKIIDNAKNTISTTLMQSKTLTSSSQFLSPSKYSKLTTTLPQQISPMPAAKVSHKQMSLKQVQQTILQILNLKRKQESISGKRLSIKAYLKYYFKYKFGLTDLSQEIRSNFTSAVRHFLSSAWTERQESPLSYGSAKQKPLLLLFQKLIDEEIDQLYFWNEYIPRGLKIIKIFKRYLNEKQRVQLKQLDRLYEGFEGISGTISNYSTNKIVFNEEERMDFEMDENDVRNILCNVYTKSKEIQTLQMIFAQIIGRESTGVNDDWIGISETPGIISRIQQPQSPRNVLSKQLLAIIICYEIESYCIRQASLTSAIKKNSTTSELATISYVSLQKIILQMKMEQEKYLPYLQQNFAHLKDREFTYSEVVEIISQINVDNNKQNYSSIKKL